MKENLEDALYAAPFFVIEEEEGEIIRYKKTRISFNSLHSTKTFSWLGADIDSLNFINFSSQETNLFCLLQKHGYKSYLIDLFAEAEKKNGSFKDPEFENILVKKSTVIPTNRSKTQSNVYHYHLNGCSLCFHRILELDVLFWPTMIKACNETEFVSLSDHPENIVEYLNGSKLLEIPSEVKELSERCSTKRRRGRPLGKKDSKPRKKRKPDSPVIDV